MIKQKLFIEKYKWNLTIIYKANQDLSIVADELWLLKCPAKIAIRAIEDVIVEKNNGFCFTNDLLKSSLICIAEADSDEQFVNTIAHEVKHLQSHICSYYNIDEKGEEAAYLVGDIFAELFKIFKYELDEFKTSNIVSYKGERQPGNYWSSTSEYPQFNCKFSWSKCYICGSGNT